MKFTDDLNGMTLRDLDDLLATAFEGGSNYWYTIEEFLHPKADDYHYLVRNPVVSNGLSDERFRTTVTFELCVATLRTLKERYPKVFGRIVDGQYDAGDADVFLQMVVLREVMYA